jgi:hypothetical protein
VEVEVFSVLKSNKILLLIVASSWVFYLGDWRCTEPQALKYSTCFGHVHCPSSGIFRHCIHTRVICHSLSNKCGKYFISLSSIIRSYCDCVSIIYENCWILIRSRIF